MPVKPLFLSDSDIDELATVGDAVDVMEEAFRAQAAGQATILPRQRLATGGVFLHLLAGAVPAYFGYKAYATGAGKARFLFFLFDSKTADLVSIMDADRLGQIRTGAATGLATRWLARDDVDVATMFGAGGQAETQLLAMDAVRDLRVVWIVNRSPERLRAFMERMAPRVRAELKPAPSAEAAVGESGLVTTITSSREPVLFGEWIAPGTHVNAAGGNMVLRRELDSRAVLGADRIVVDSIEQARIECGEFLPVFGVGRRHWDEVFELKDIVARGGRERPEEITLYKSLGVGLEDVALGARVYERARERGLGRPLDL